MIEIVTCEQGTPEWFAARLGIPTASEFSIVMSIGSPGGLSQDVMDAMVKSGCTAAQLSAANKAARKRTSSGSLGRLDYMRKLAGEIFTGDTSDGYSNAAMDRGHEMETDARNAYSFAMDCDVEQVGFIRNGRKGYSPDGLVGANGLVEIKSKAPHILIDVWERDRIPPEHMAQIQGGLWTAEREWLDFVAYWPKMKPYIRRAYRDEEYISRLVSEVDRFNEELDALVERMRSRFGSRVDVSVETSELLMAGE